MTFISIFQILLFAFVAAYVFGLLGPSYAPFVGLAALVFIGLRFVKFAQVAKVISDYTRSKPQAKPGDGSNKRDPAAD